MNRLPVNVTDKRKILLGFPVGSLYSFSKRVWPCVAVVLFLLEVMFFYFIFLPLSFGFFSFISIAAFLNVATRISLWHVFPWLPSSGSRLVQCISCQTMNELCWSTVKQVAGSIIGATHEPLSNDV